MIFSLMIKKNKYQTVSNYQKWRKTVLKTHFVIVFAVFLVEVINNIILYITKSQGYNDDTILPKDVADELEENPDATIAKSFPKATVLFTDIVGLTKMTSEMQADDIVKVLNGIVTKFDICAQKK